MSQPAVRRVYEGRVVKLNVETFTLPNGNTATIEVVRHPGAAAVVPLTAQGNVLLIRQFRHAAGGFIVEVPAGKLDGGESPETCARRELEEEAGVRAGELIHLGSILTTPGFTDEVIHLFVARDLAPATQALEADEVLTVEEIDLPRAVAMCVDGSLRDAKSICAILLADAFVRRERRA